jgi:hypothetical protein
MTVVGLAVALMASSAANAATWIATLTGQVTEQFVTALTAPGVTSPIKVGDTVTATFRYNDAGTVSEALAVRFGMAGANKAVFSVAGLSWSSDQDFLQGQPAPQFAPGADPLRDYYSTMSGLHDGGDLRIRRYAFEIRDFGYGELYVGPGFRGTFDPATLKTVEDVSVASLAAVPEATVWAQLIAGFAIVGTAIRQRQKRRAKWLGLVARLSGRVREA